MKDRFQTIISNDKPVLVDFYADWCSPCKTMAPILKQIKDELGDGVRIIKVNVDNNPALASNYGIQSIPTLILFKHGAAKWKGIGVKSFHEIKQVVSSHI